MTGVGTASTALHRPTRSSWADRHRDDLVVTALFVAARVAFIVAAGARMDLAFLRLAPHLPDLGQLQDRLVHTVLYEHTQPPGLPLLVGLLLKLSPFPDGITFHVAYLAMGLALALALRRIFRQAGLGRIAAFVAIALVVTNPGLVSIEMSASYDEPTILLVALFVLWAGRYVGTGRTRDLGLAAGLASAIVLTRTVFHPVWYLVAIGGLVAMRRPLVRDRRTLAVLTLPALLITAFVVKNTILYGEPTLTTWTGASLSKIAGAASRPAERNRLIADRTVSPLFGRPIFWGYETYDDAMPPCRPDHRDVPVLADKRRPGNLTPNLNYECFLPVYRQQQRDAVAFLRKRPVRFAGAELVGAQMLFEPTLPLVFTRNEPKLRGTDRLYSWTLFPRLRLQPVSYSEFGALRVLSHGGIDLLPTVLLLDLGAIVYGCSRIRPLVRRRSRAGGGPRRVEFATWSVVGLTSLWVTVVGSFLEINENARYRLLIEPFLLGLLVLVIERAVRAVRSRREGAPPEVPAG